MQINLYLLLRADHPKSNEPPLDSFVGVIKCVLVGEGGLERCPGSFFGHNWSKILVFPSSSGLHVEILRFFFVNLRYIL